MCQSNVQETLEEADKKFLLIHVDLCSKVLKKPMSMSTTFYSKALHGTSHFFQYRKKNDHP